MTSLTILWFRRDLRLHDNSLLSLKTDTPVLPIFIFDKGILDKLLPNDRRISFLWDSVINLKEQLQQVGLDLALFYGDSVEVFNTITQTYKINIEKIYANVDYDAYAKERDRKIASQYLFHRLYDSYIFEPNEIMKDDQTPYLVFSAFYNRVKKSFTPYHARIRSRKNYLLARFDYKNIHQITKEKLPIKLSHIGFNSTPYYLPKLCDILPTLEQKISNYESHRDQLQPYYTSKLSVYIRFGNLVLESCYSD